MVGEAKKKSDNATKNDPGDGKKAVKKKRLWTTNLATAKKSLADAVNELNASESLISLVVDAAQGVACVAEGKLRTVAIPGFRTHPCRGCPSSERRSS
jgi:hypothetical protein